MTDKEKLDIAVKALVEVQTVDITDGCGECSAIWQHTYELKAVTRALKDIGYRRPVKKIP